jgi:TolA-binding protein
LQKFEQQFTNSVLKPDVEFAIARTYELETNLPVAIASYQAWLADHPTNALVPQVLFSLGRADFSDGNEADAFTVFTNFVARFPLDDLAPQAQYWIADHYFRAGEWTGAETNYEAIFQTRAWQNSSLIYAARFMAGRAAMGRQGFQDAATHYFSVLLDQTNCPPDIAVQARFAYGSDLMLYDSGDTNNPQSNLQNATNAFGQVIQMYPTNQYGARAWGQLADCARQLGDFDGATNAYFQVVNSAVADVALRSRAQIGMGITLEKKAKFTGGDDLRSLLQLALDNYLDVFRKNNLRDGELADEYWMQTAGMKAGAVEETLGNWDEAVEIYNRLEAQMPQLKDLLEKKKAAAGAHRLDKKM